DKTAAQGLEPRLPRPERGVLPLHQAATDSQDIDARALSASAICSRAAETSTPSASRRRASARSSERSTLSAPATLPSFRYQTESSPASRSPRQISSSQSTAGPTYSRLAQSARSLKK